MLVFVIVLQLRKKGGISLQVVMPNPDYAGFFVSV